MSTEYVLVVIEAEIRSDLKSIYVYEHTCYQLIPDYLSIQGQRYVGRFFDQLVQVIVENDLT